MTQLTEEALQKICDFLETNANYNAAAASASISESTLYLWRSKCAKDQQAGDESSPFYICRKGTWMFWTQAVAEARRVFYLSYTGTLLQQAKDGVEVPVRDASQRIIYARDPRYISRTDEYVRISEGLDGDADVEWYRLLKDENGHPIPETKVEQIPAQLRLRVLEAAAPEFRPTSHQTIESHSTVTHVQKAPERPASERVDLAELRALAAMPAEERRKRFGASAHPKDANGLRTIPRLSPPLTGDQDDAAGHGLRRPEPFVRPQQPAPPQPQPQQRPSYARPQPALDRGEGVGEGEVPHGGFKVA